MSDNVIILKDVDPDEEEGWLYISSRKKSHYFRRRMALCSRLFLLNPAYDFVSVDSPTVNSPCEECKGILNKQPV